MLSLLSESGLTDLFAVEELARNDEPLTDEPLTDEPVRSDTLPAADAGSEGGPAFVLARALHNFTAELISELSIKSGDIISFVRVIDSEWLEGTLDGKTGLFPATFVELIDNDSTSTPNGNNSAVMATVLYDFQAEMADEVNLHHGQSVYVIEESASEWTRIRTQTGEEALCPTLFLDVPLKLDVRSAPPNGGELQVDQI